MKIHLNNRIAIFYPGKFDKTEALEELLQAQRIELRRVEPEALGLSVAALVGFVNTPPPTLTFEGEAPSASCLVFSGLTEQKLSRALDSLAEELPGIDFKAVMTADNRDWAFGALIGEMEKERQEQETEKPETDKE